MPALTSRCTNVASESSDDRNSRSYMTVSAPFVKILIRPSGPRTTVDILFLLELNSQTFRISYSMSLPSILTKTDFGFRVFE